MNTIFDVKKKCRCFDCRRDQPVQDHILQEIRDVLPLDLEKRCRLRRDLYYLKPFSSDSWTKDWKSVTHRDFTFRRDLWSIEFPEKDPNYPPIEYICEKWCERPHNTPISATDRVPEETYRRNYAAPRACTSIQEQDFTWDEDYRNRGPFPGWCLRGHPPHFKDEDRG